MEAPIADRRRSKRAQIRKAAYRCFRDRGYHETSVDDICREAGISKGSLYWHYDSKQDVFIDILDSWANQVMEEVYDQFDQALGEEDYSGALSEALERELHRGRAIGPLWLEFAVHARRDPKLQPVLAKFFRRARSAIAEMLRPEVGFLLTDDEVEGLSTTIFGAYMGILMQDLVDPEGARAEESFERFLRVLKAWLGSLRDLLAGPVPSVPTAPGVGRVDEPELRAFMSAFPEDVRHRVREVRNLVHEAAPLADERVIRGWGVLGYEAGRLFAYVKPRRDGVHLGFYHGVDLEDPRVLLRGRGKRVRYVPLTPVGPLDRAALMGLVGEALGQSP